MIARPILAVLALCSLAPAQWNWTELGPAPIASGPYTGRIAAIATSRTDANLYFVAGADAGVWKSTNGGGSWSPLTDLLPSTATGAIALDPGNDQVIYVGSGEANFANHSRYGLGLFKSTDGGASWNVLAPSTFAGRCIARLAIDPTSTNRVFAAVTTAGGFPALAAARGHAQRTGPLGALLSTDGGHNFAQLGGGLPADLSATDLALDSGNPQHVFVAIGHIFGDPRNGVYRSTNGGVSFTRLAGGLPTVTVGRIALAAAPSQAGRFYALIVNPATAAGGNATTLNVFRTDDGGNTWTPLNPGNFQSTNGWYYCAIAVAPTSANTVFVGGMTCLRSTDAGATWVTRTPPHVDLHAFGFDAAGRLLCGNDGGLHFSPNNGDNWSAIVGGLGTIQCYAGVAIHPSQDEVFHGGFQDNGSNRRTAGPSWTQVLGGDGGYAGITPDGNTAFAEYQGTGTIFRSVGGGAFAQIGSGLTGRNCFLAPYEIDPQTPARMIYGTERVWLSSNSGTSFTAISPDLTGGAGAIQGLTFAPGNSSYIYVATNDGRIQMTPDGGLNWRLRRSGVPSWPRTTRPFAVHPGNPQRVWLAVSQFGTDKLLYSSDAGMTWRGLTGNLGDIPANAVAVDSRVDPPVLYLGTDQGVWRSQDHGGSWLRFGRNFPNVPVVDLRVELGRGRVVAATQGRGLWRIALPGPAEVEPVPASRN